MIKTEEVRKLVKNKELEKALKIAGKFKRQIGMDLDQLKQLQLGYSCLMYPSFYLMLGKDTTHEIEQAYKVLNEVYGDSASNSELEEVK